ncbi:FxSxx-COOH system tetratricopeptide repeat protein [Microdochium nivale]|nr:FxSxx-COOH system tetratricopeptide repeat protein [Microdochium nivale]
MAEKDGPVFLLSLDGGGVRGICELVVLDTIMRRIQQEQGLSKIPRPCEYFHLIGGVSTGGLVAILLGRLQMTTTDAIAAYNDFAQNIFGRGNWKLRSFVPFVREHKAGVKVGRTLFGTKKLEKIIQDLVASTKNDEMLLDERGNELAKAFVCTQKHNDTGATSLILLRTYKVSSNPLPRSFLQQIEEPPRPDQPAESDSGGTQQKPPESLQPVPAYEHCKIWEAARATSAASVFFTPLELLDDLGESTLFIDAAVGCNNPVKHVIAEAAALFGVDRKLGCLLSLGTGVQGSGQITTETGSAFALLMAAKAHLTTSEVNNREVEERIRPEANAYFRLNLPMVEKVGLASYRMIDQLAADTTKYLQEQQTAAIVERIVEILLRKHKPKLNLGQVTFSDQGQFAPRKPPQGRPVTTSHFIGRDDVIQRLAAKLVPDRSTRSTALIWAPGGVGKTSTASKFLDEYESKFEEIFWVDATNEETISAAYALIAERENLPTSGSNVTRLVLDWLAKLSSHWLLVLDNTQGDITNYLPPGNRGHLLLTSRNKEIRPRVPMTDIIELENMKEEDAVTLLLNIAGRDSQSEQNRQDAAKIARDQLAYLPLAIEQAAKHMQLQQISLPEYASRFEKYREFLLNRRTGSKAPDTAQEIPPGTEAVQVSFDLTYDALTEAAYGDTREAHTAKNALRLLSAFSFYANDGLIGSIFQRAAVNRPAVRTPEQLGARTMLSLEPLLLIDSDTKEWNMDAFRSGTLCLKQWGLLKTDSSNSVFSMHILTHDWARERTNSRERLAHAEAARHILFDSYAWTNKETHDWIFNRRLMPHMKACFANTQVFADSNPVIDASHKDRYAEMLMHEDRPHEAIRLLEMPLEAFAKEGRIFSEEYWHMLRTMAESSLSLGMLDEAERLAKQIMRLQEVLIQLGKFKPASVTVLNTQILLVDIMAQRGRWEEAEPKFHEIIAAGIAANGEGHWLGYWLSTLQTKYTLHSQHEEAFLVAKRTYETCHRLYEPGHKNALDSTRNLARACVQSGRYEEAESFAFDVLRVEEEKSSRGTHMQTLNKSKVLLADICLRQERYEEAYELFHKVVEDLRLEPATSAHEDLPGAYQGLGEAALFLGQWAEGLKYGRMAFMFLYDHLGPESKKTRQAAATVLLWLGQAKGVGFTVNGPKWEEFWLAVDKVEPWEPAQAALLVT